MRAVRLQQRVGPAGGGHPAEHAEVRRLRPGRLRGRVALITGGGGGIGEATGRLFAEEGASLALVDASAEAVQSTAKAIAGAVESARVLPLVADVSREDETRRVVADVLAHYGALHCLVNVAGVRVYQPLAAASAEDWQTILGVNVLGTAYCCKAAIPALRAVGGGTIVNVSSVYGVMGRKGMGQYDTTKAAVLGMTRALAAEEAPHGIRVNAVCPGSTITPYHIRRAAAQGQSEAELRQRTAGENLLGRWAEPREIAYPILFLACEESSYITGATLMVDAGKSIV
ncbi:MAG TPA: SDR family oxidoreductase [Methylomirabilota bacterium]|nr:SDR family oxidoreductase [Methylomirabilota bacterium]